MQKILSLISRGTTIFFNVGGGSEKINCKSQNIVNCWIPFFLAVVTSGDLWKQILRRMNAPYETNSCITVGNVRVECGDGDERAKLNFSNAEKESILGECNDSKSHRISDTWGTFNCYCRHAMGRFIQWALNDVTRLLEEEQHSRKNPKNMTKLVS